MLVFGVLKYCAMFRVLNNCFAKTPNKLNMFWLVVWEQGIMVKSLGKLAKSDCGGGLDQ